MATRQDRTLLVVADDFGIGPATSQGILDLAATLSPKPASIAMLAADDSFSQEVAKATVASAEKSGFQVVLNQKYPNGSTDLTSLVSQTKAKNPDMVLNSGHLA